MKKIFLSFILFLISVFLGSCNSNKISFVVNESSHSAIIIKNENYYTEDLVIYKSVEQLYSDIDIKSESIKSKYNEDFFENSALVFIYGTAASITHKRTFKSITVKKEELILNAIIDKRGESMGVIYPYLFFIEIEKSKVEEFDRIKRNYKIKE